MNTYKARNIRKYVASIIMLTIAALLGILYGRATAPEPDPEIVETPAVIEVLEPLGLRGNIQNLIEWQQAINAEQAALNAEIGVLVEGAAMFAPPTTTTTTTTVVSVPPEAQTD